jgi:hypothetical protein
MWQSWSFVDEVTLSDLVLILGLETAYYSFYRLPWRLEEVIHA